MDPAKSPSEQAREHNRGGRPPLIALSVCHDAGKRLRPGSDYWYVNRNYTRALARAGALPLLVCPDAPPEATASVCDGLVLSGGDDLPASFSGAAFATGEWVAAAVGEPESLERIAAERALLEAFATQGKPVLGVCFGMQLMNLHFGGTLVADLGANGQRLDHGGGGRATAHALALQATSPFFAGLRLPTRVSSSHRQGIEDVAPGFVASAWSEDGLVEAIERPGLIGVEWHPESDASGALVYGRFVELVAANRR